MRLTLPVPPSVNNYHAVYRGRKITSEAGRKWQGEATLAIIEAKPKQLTGPVKITATWYRARKAGDLSNRIKPVEDILVKTGILVDDNQIEELHWKRREDKAWSRVVIEVEQIQEAAT